jgi:hypothetical protein
VCARSRADHADFFQNAMKKKDRKKFTKKKEKKKKSAGDECKKREKGAFETRRDAVSVTKHPGALYFFLLFFSFYSLATRNGGTLLSMSIQTLKINSFFFLKFISKKEKTHSNITKITFEFFLFFVWARNF